MATGCPERFDWEFIRWILWDGRTNNAKERYQQLSDTYPEKMHILHSQAEIDYFLQSLKKQTIEQHSIKVTVWTE